MNTEKNNWKTITIGRQNLNGLSILIILISFLSISCKNASIKIDKREVDRIKIAYMPKGITTDISIENCDEIFSYPKGFLKDTVITNESFIKKFVSCVNSLKKSEETDIYYDFRIICLIKFKDGSTQQICMGENQLIVYD
jgi:hypothetical protein